MFASVLPVVVSCFNLIHGIAAIANSHVFTANAHYHQVLAQWTTPDGRARTGRIPVSADMADGRTVRLWVDSAGSPTGIPLNHRLVLAQEATAAVIATVALGIVLLCLAWAGRWVLDRRRLADWQAGWAAVGPQWTRRFRSRG